jgi:hypothetical protein
VPERLEAIVLRAMSLDPLGRFDSVKQLGAALLEFSSESTRMLWSPFFGAAPAIEMPASGSPLANAPTLSGAASSRSAPASRPPSTDRPRVATLVAPSTTPSGATMELPQPAHNRKAASTTLRNATGERALSTRPGTPPRWRAPAIVGGVALVAAISVLVILRGTGGGDRREDAESTSASTPSTETSHPVIAKPDEPKIAQPIARPPEVKPPSTEPTAEPTPIQNPPASAKTGAKTTPATGEPAATRREDAAAPHKAGAKGTRKGGAAKGAHAGKTTPTASPQESSPPAKTEETTKNANGAPVINP